MAEFQEVIKQMKRMCAHFGPTCNGCPLWLEKGTDEFCGEVPNDIHSDPALVEAAVMQWAAENPEPVYPTWVEWFREIGVVSPEQKGFHVWLHDHIPANIAKKLGLQPKEG